MLKKGKIFVKNLEKWETLKELDRKMTVILLSLKIERVASQLCLPPKR